MLVSKSHGKKQLISQDAETPPDAGRYIRNQQVHGETRACKNCSVHR